MGKKKSNRKSNTLGKVVGFQDILNSEKTDFLLGLILFFIAGYLLIAMVSFLFTGQADQSILESLRAGEWLNSNRMFTNICGSIGAILSYELITLTFGISGFLIPVFVVLAGLKLMRIYQPNLWKWFFYLMIVMEWCSISFAKFLTPLCGNLSFNPGGAHGLYCMQTIENVVGAPGLIILLAFTALTFLTYLSAKTITYVRYVMNPVKYVASRVKLTVTNHLNDDEAENDASLQHADDEEDVAEDEIEQMDNGLPEDLPAPVVDLTNFDAPPVSSFKEDAMTPICVQNSDEIDEKMTSAEGKLTVEVAKDEEKADGKVVNIDEILRTPINPLEPFTQYKKPTLDLLKKYDNGDKPTVDMDEIKANNARIVEVLNSFGVSIREIKATVGPTITLYEITPAEGVRISKIRNLEDDIALSLSALGIRIIAPIPGKGTIGIEVPNKKPQIVSMESILNSKKFKETKMELPLALGKTITNEVFMVDLAKIPHLLVAGATGQGKSVGLNAIITSLLYKKHPNELKFVLVDPKKVEFSIYHKISDHFMACLPENDEEPIITDVTKVVHTLNSLCALMDHRYDLLKNAGAKNLREYNEKFINHRLDITKGHDYMPYIVVIIDEFGDLIMTAGKEIELPIARIAQLARAVGIHMVIATQRPTTKIITGNIKANFPGRMAFRVSSQIDSRTILDRSGANQLVGRGDLLFLNGNEPVRVQCAFVDTPEIERINDYIENEPGPVEPLELPEPVEDTGGSGMGNATADVGSLDPFFEEAAHAVVLSQQGSTSMIQRRF